MQRRAAFDCPAVLPSHSLKRAFELIEIVIAGGSERSPVVIEFPARPAVESRARDIEREVTMDTYIIAASGAWRRYHPMEVPKGWRMLGTIECASDHSTGALARSPAGVYAQINVRNVRILDQRAVADALRKVVLPPPPRHGTESLRR